MATREHRSYRAGERIGMDARPAVFCHQTVVVEQGNRQGRDARLTVKLTKDLVVPAGTLIDVHSADCYRLAVSR